MFCPHWSGARCNACLGPVDHGAQFLPDGRRCKVFQPQPRDTGRQRPERAVWRAERAEATRAIRLRRRVCRSLRKTRSLALAAFNQAVEIFFDLAFMFLKLARAIVFPALAPYRDRGLHSFDVILLCVRRLIGSRLHVVSVFDLPQCRCAMDPLCNHCIKAKKHRAIRWPQIPMNGDKDPYSQRFSPLA